MTRVLGACLLTLATSCSGDDRRRDTPPAGRLAIETASAGWIRVEASDLIAAGLAPLADPRSLGLTRDGQPVALELETAGAASLLDAGSVGFYAEPPDSYYSTIAVYWLGPSAEPLGLEPASTPMPGPAAGFLSSRATVAPPLLYAITILNGERSNFFWDFVHAANGPASKDFALELDSAQDGGTFRLSLGLHASSSDPARDPDHHVVVRLNGHTVGDMWSEGAGPLDLVLEGPSAWLVDGANTVTLALPHDATPLGETIVLQSIVLEHPRTAWSASSEGGKQIDVGANAPGSYRFGGLPPETRILDVSDPRRPRLVRGGPIAIAPRPPPGHEDENEDPPPDPGLLFSVDPPVEGGRYLLLPPQTALPALRVRAPRGADPRLETTPADLWIVAPDELRPAAERLVSHRIANGTTTRLLSWEAVVDHFGHGIPDPAALRALVTTVEPPPRWLLVVGDASFDPNGVLSDEPSGHRIPASFTDTPFLETPSDNPAVAGGVGDRPTLAMGRLPAGDLTEAHVMVDKILAYEGAASGPWQNRVLLVADNAESTEEYMLFEDTTAQFSGMVSSPLMPIRVSVGDLGGAGARAELTAQLASGALLVNYLGHGSYTRWAVENIFSDDDVAPLPASDALPVYLVMNCLSGYYAHPNWKLRSLGERLLITPDRGAVAVIASSSLAYPAGQSEFDLAFAESVLRGDTLGEALLEAKSALDPSIPEHADILASWHLLGDPSMRLRLP